MIVEVPFKYRVRLRKQPPGEAEREVADATSATIEDMTSDAMPLAARWTGPGGTKKEYRVLDGKWMSAFQGGLESWKASAGTSPYWARCGGPPPGWKREPLPSDTPLLARAVENERDDSIQRIARIATEAVVLDDVIWSPCPEPRWILTNWFPGPSSPGFRVYVATNMPRDAACFPLDRLDLLANMLRRFSRKVETGDLELLDPSAPFSAPETLACRCLIALGESHPLEERLGAQVWKAAKQAAREGDVEALKATLSPAVDPGRWHPSLGRNYSAGLRRFTSWLVECDLDHRPEEVEAIASAGL